MPKISSTIRTCISGASALLDRGKKSEAEAILKAAYDAATLLSSKSDADFVLNALQQLSEDKSRFYESALMEPTVAAKKRANKKPRRQGGNDISPLNVFDTTSSAAVEQRTSKRRRP